MNNKNNSEGLDKFLEQQKNQKPDEFARAELLVREKSALPYEPIEVREYSELPGLTLPLSEYEKQKIDETTKRVFSSKPYRTLPELEAYYKQHGTTGGENYITAMHNLAAELIKRRHNSGK